MNNCFGFFRVLLLGLRENPVLIIHVYVYSFVEYIYVFQQLLIVCIYTHKHNGPECHAAFHMICALPLKT